MTTPCTFTIQNMHRPSIRAFMHMGPLTHIHAPCNNPMHHATASLSHVHGCMCILHQSAWGHGLSVGSFFLFCPLYTHDSNSCTHAGKQHGESATVRLATSKPTVPASATATCHGLNQLATAMTGSDHSIKSMRCSVCSRTAHIAGARSTARAISHCRSPCLTALNSAHLRSHSTASTAHVTGATCTALCSTP